MASACLPALGVSNLHRRKQDISTVGDEQTTEFQPETADSSAERNTGSTSKVASSVINDQGSANIPKSDGSPKPIHEKEKNGVAVRSDAKSKLKKKKKKKGAHQKVCDEGTDSFQSPEKHSNRNEERNNCKKAGDDITQVEEQLNNLSLSEELIERGPDRKRDHHEARQLKPYDKATSQRPISDTEAAEFIGSLLFDDQVLESNTDVSYATQSVGIPQQPNRGQSDPVQLSGQHVPGPVDALPSIPIYSVPPNTFLSYSNNFGNVENRWSSPPMQGSVSYGTAICNSSQLNPFHHGCDQTNMSVPVPAATPHAGQCFPTSQMNGQLFNVCNVQFDGQLMTLLQPVSQIAPGNQVPIQANVTHQAQMGTVLGIPVVNLATDNMAGTANSDIVPQHQHRPGIPTVVPEIFEVDEPKKKGRAKKSPKEGNGIKGRKKKTRSKKSESTAETSLAAGEAAPGGPQANGLSSNDQKVNDNTEPVNFGHVQPSSVGQSSCSPESVGQRNYCRESVEQGANGPGSVGQRSSGPGSVGQSSCGPNSVLQGSSGPGSVGQSSCGPGSVGRSSSGPGSVGQSSSGPGSVGQSSCGPNSVLQGSSGPGSVGQDFCDDDVNLDEDDLLKLIDTIPLSPCNINREIDQNDNDARFQDALEVVGSDLKQSTATRHTRNHPENIYPHQYSPSGPESGYTLQNSGSQSYMPMTDDYLGLSECLLANVNGLSEDTSVASRDQTSPLPVEGIGSPSTQTARCVVGKMQSDNTSLNVVTTSSSSVVPDTYSNNDQSVDGNISPSLPQQISPYHPWTGQHQSNQLQPRVLIGCNRMRSRTTPMDRILGRFIPIVPKPNN